MTRTPSLDRADKARAAAGRSQQEKRASGPGQAKRLVLLCALLLALLWQGVVAQAHQHRQIGFAAVQTEASVANDRRDDSAPDSARNCPICEANIGPALLPTPVVVEAPVPPAFFGATSRLRQLQRSSRSHLWQSRAPPRQHQA